MDIEVSITAVDWIPDVYREGLQDATMAIRNKGRIALMIFMVRLPCVMNVQPSRMFVGL
jgi:hypothetical protein